MDVGRHLRLVDEAIAGIRRRSMEDALRRLNMQTLRMGRCLRKVAESLCLAVGALASAVKGEVDRR